MYIDRDIKLNLYCTTVMTTILDYMVPDQWRDKSAGKSLNNHQAPSEIEKMKAAATTAVFRVRKHLYER